MRTTASAVLVLATLFFHLEFAQSETASSRQGTGSANGAKPRTEEGGCNGKTSSIPKIEIDRLVKEVHGPEANCFKELYIAETSMNPSCHQTHTPNPPGIGLCTIEGNPLLRDRRGEACRATNQEMDGNDEKGIRKQMECCAEIFKQAREKYFEPLQSSEKVKSACKGASGIVKKDG